MLKYGLFIFFFLQWAGSLFAAPLLTYETFTLKNGLQFFLMKNERAPIVSYTTWFKVGSADEVSGKTGLAHYLEHMMESSMPEVQMGQFLEDFNSSGNHSNAFTSYDVTYYYKMVMVENLQNLMRYEAGRMRGVAFNKDTFETERNVILEERLMRTENEPSALFDEKFNSQFFTTHPYKNPIIGWEKDIRALTFEDIKSFHKKWYHPNNAFVIISGDFDPIQVRKWAEQYYGDIPSGQRIERNRPQEPLKKPKIEPIVVEHPRVPETSFVQIYSLPDLKEQNLKDLLALLLLSEYLDGDFEGSLEEILVHKKKLATSFNVQCEFLHFIDPWSFAINVNLAPQSDVKEVEAIINERLEEIVRDGLKQEDLILAVKYVFNELILSSDDIYGKAVLLGNLLSSGLMEEQFNSLPDKLKEITVEDIQRVIKTYLIKDKAVIGILKKPPSSSSDTLPQERL
jgi:zinc protease